MLHSPDMKGCLGHDGREGNMTGRDGWHILSGNGPFKTTRILNMKGRAGSQWKTREHEDWSLMMPRFIVFEIRKTRI